MLSLADALGRVSLSLNFGETGETAPTCEDSLPSFLAKIAGQDLPDDDSPVKSLSNKDNHHNFYQTKSEI